MKKLIYVIVGIMTFMMIGMNVKAEGEIEITEMNITINSPEVGKSVSITSATCTSGVNPDTGEEDTFSCSVTSPLPDVVVENTYHITEMFGKKEMAWLRKLPSEVTADPTDYEAYETEMFYTNEELDGLTFEAGKEYALEFNLAPNDGYVFAENVVLKINGKTTGYELNENNTGLNMLVYTKVTVGESSGSSSDTTSTEATSTTYETLEGASQTFSTSSTDKMTFRFNVDYAKFEANGKVYVDDKLVDPSNYTSKSGSTIIVFNTNYLKKLANGKHTLKVDFGDGTATTDFTITGNPKTGDNVLVFVGLLVISALGLAINHKKSLN